MSSTNSSERCVLKEFSAGCGSLVTPCGLRCSKIKGWLQRTKSSKAQETQKHLPRLSRPSEILSRDALRLSFRPAFHESCSGGPRPRAELQPCAAATPDLTHKRPSAQQRTSIFPAPSHTPRIFSTSSQLTRPPSHPLFPPIHSTLQPPAASDHAARALAVASP